MANKGTIFLDEIGDLDPSCQVKLLRVLQDQTFEVLGDSRPRKTDIRLVELHSLKNHLLQIKVHLLLKIRHVLLKFQKFGNGSHIHRKVAQLVHI